MRAADGAQGGMYPRAVAGSDACRLPSRHELRTAAERESRMRRTEDKPGQFQIALQYRRGAIWSPSGRQTCIDGAEEREVVYQCTSWLRSMQVPCKWCGLPSGSRWPWQPCDGRRQIMLRNRNRASTTGWCTERLQSATITTTHLFLREWSLYVPPRALATSYKEPCWRWIRYEMNEEQTGMGVQATGR